MATRLQMTQSSESSAEAQSDEPLAELYADARVVDADDLFAGEQEVFIRHGDELYRLRKTRHGKLILNK